MRERRKHGPQPDMSLLAGYYRTYACIAGGFRCTSDTYVAHVVAHSVYVFVCIFFLYLLAKKYASLPELFSKDAVLEELGVLPEDIQGMQKKKNYS